MHIDFIFDVENRLIAACHVIKKYYSIGYKFIIFCDNHNMRLFNRMLWSFDDISFIPHVFITDGLAKDTPIILTNTCPSESVKIIGLEIEKFWLLNISDICPPNYFNFIHLIEIVSREPDDRFFARKRWKEYKAGNNNLHSYKLSNDEYHI
ncbi:MAG: DNA polymerase III subunit chi [Bordetella sp.]|nr:MAG: DNA polymerase III subunit chi [Bordetella sp.]